VEAVAVPDFQWRGAELTRNPGPLAE
jgi:hypothetical protein